ncbi:tripartite tricarboxylate transporter substrate-binding protein [Roseomonas sp. NAR14]|uniref:Tripartite tricarboxylate transporter substrate-binding protein n=1 Tax=Roseomonas acroporae TaxID=2937791 RepID=A0A9X1YCJ6_9PROT|nr:tripartite tricarboxylate transporter substrate-binding protein [Roseomonas acroporae]MCK8787282.1 tripartite tricarboxylate transporter substrate-binding protein [Roseomonas acroporae]
MSTTRRAVLGAALGAALGGFAAATLARRAAAQPWQPERPLRLVVPYAPGGATDLLGRAIAERLGRELGQAVVVENRPGANTIVGTELVARAAPDGHTLLMASGASLVLNPLLYRRLPYDADRDLLALAIMVEAPLVMVVPPRLAASDVAEFVALARRAGDATNYATVGNGNPIQLAAELFRMAAGIDMTGVVYPGSAPALAALVAGDVQVMFDVVLTALPLVREGRLRALAVTTRGRLPALPDVPTVAESGFPGYEAGTWFGVAVPRATPAAAAERLRAALAAVQRDADFAARFDALGLLVQPPRDAAAIAAHLAAERTRWGGVIRARGIALD